MPARALFWLISIVVACASLDGRAEVQVTGSFVGHFAQDTSTVTFSCSGSPTCTGVYTQVTKHLNCSNTDTMTAQFVMTGVALSQPGPINGTVAFSGESHNNPNPNGTCTFDHVNTSANIATYSGTWDGQKGTFTFQVPDGFNSNIVTVDVAFTASGVAPPPAFPMPVYSNITPTTANVTATIQPKPADVGTTQKVFVFLYVPSSLLSGPKLLKDGPDPCVLAQMNANGQPEAASAASLTPAVNGVLDAQGSSIDILHNVPTPSVSGGSAYAGYGPDSSTMFTNGNYQGVVNIPGGTGCNTNLANTARASAPGALTGLWWNAAESGWGIHFTQRGSKIFAAWYTYDASGKPKWYVSTCEGMTGQSGTCNGTLYEVTGPSFFGGTFNPSLVNATNAGTLTLTFTNSGAASMRYTATGITRTVALTRQPLGSGTVTPAVDFSDIWWGGNSESGWGMAMAQQSGTTFVAWYVYDSSGKPTWLVATCTMSGNTGTGALYRTSGPPFGPTFDTSRVTATPAGTVTVKFTDPNNATLEYTVDGVAGTKALTRQVF